MIKRFLRKEKRVDVTQHEFDVKTGKVATIIVPIRTKSIQSQNIRRLYRLLNTIPDTFEVIVVDDGSPAKVSKQIEHLVSRHHLVRYLYISSAFKSFSLARARNYGAIHASTPVVIFHDVDFLAPTETYSKLTHEVGRCQLATEPKNFFCVPVAFLTPKGTDRFLKKEEVSLKESMSEDYRAIVYGSSCLVMNRAHLLSIGGHDESYKGHGAEDFELLHRLGTLFPIAEKPKQYSTNFGSGTIDEYKGFRAYFALFGKSAYEKDIVFVHLYHPKRNIRGYYKHKRNFTKLKKLMES